MDDTDRRLIALLRHDGRMPVAKLAGALGLGRAAVASRMDRLRRDGTIEGFTVVLRDAAAPAPVRGIVMIELQGRLMPEVTASLDRMPEVRAIHTTAGRWGLICEIGTEDLAAFDDLLWRIERLRGVTRSETNLYLTTKRSAR
ncbi:Lrp/AsnC family transcriptional regulator [Jannaschia sp. LMIT008]|uniref:Lrp/AsnC family transcriptional regulator n=1 Tax=Jannaschia maritima TaxID=3032585 RepID=UPI00281243A8|nr:Lrp/AsnC family transcriptional regulator [Jannaschia sp. LMIT008]